MCRNMIGWNQCIPWFQNQGRWTRKREAWYQRGWRHLIIPFFRSFFFNLFSLFSACYYFSIIFLMNVNINIICWNCRGASGLDKINRIRSMKKDLKLDLIALVETRADDSRIRCFCSKFSKQWNWDSTSSKGYSRGIIILWHQKIGKITPVAHSKHALHLIISISCGNRCIFTMLYNAQSIKMQKYLYKELS